MSKGIGDAIEALIKGFIFLLIFAVPLAIWKLIKIIIWLCTKVSVSFN